MASCREGCQGKGLNILTLTSLFPNNVNPVLGVFIKERVRYLAKLHNLRVVAPVPYFPRIKFHRRWYEHSRVKYRERIAGLEVCHPRYFITPRVGNKWAIPQIKTRIPPMANKISFIINKTSCSGEQFLVALNIHQPGLQINEFLVHSLHADQQ